jgi:hypothetical protein
LAIGKGLKSHNFSFSRIKTQQQKIYVTATKLAKQMSLKIPLGTLYENFQ